MVISSLRWRLAAVLAFVGCSGAGADRAERGGGGDVAEHLLRAGTGIELRSSDSVSSRHSHAGDVVTAVSVADVRDGSGAVVLPAGALFVGTVQAIASGGQNRPGTLSIAFTRVRISGREHPIRSRVASLATRNEGRGITGGTVAKTGAGTAIGAIAGRIIGGNRTGTIVGAAAGTAAGATYAHVARDIDVVLPRGAAIRLVLTGPFPGASAEEGVARGGAR